MSTNIDTTLRHERLSSKAEILCAVLLFAGVLGSLCVLVHPWYDATNDGSTYIITARALAAGQGYTFLGMPFGLRPPGFSAMIAPLVQGGVPVTSCFGLNLFVSLFGVLALLLLVRHQRSRVGWVLALLTAAALWLNPGYQRLCNQVMSDVPGLALLVAGLLLERWASRAPARRREIVLGAAIGLAFYVRTVLVLLVPAIVLSRLLSRSLERQAATPWPSFIGRRLIPFAAVAWLVSLPWSVAGALHAPPSPADQTLNYSLGTAMWHKDPGDPSSPRYSAGEILERVPRHAYEIGLVLGSRLGVRIPGDDPPGPWTGRAYAAVASLLLCCLAVVLVRRREPAEFFAAGALGVAAFYFVFTDRLVLPVYVLAFTAAVEVAHAVLRRVAGTRAATAVTASAILLLIGVDFAPRRGWSDIERKHRGFVELATALHSRLPPDTNLVAGQGLHYDVYLERPVYSLMHAVHRAGGFEAAEEVIDKYGLNTVILSPLVPQDREFVPYFTQRYGRGTPAASALLWRVRPVAGRTE